MALVKKENPASLGVTDILDQEDSLVLLDPEALKEIAGNLESKVFQALLAEEAFPDSKVLREKKEMQANFWDWTIKHLEIRE